MTDSPAKFIDVATVQERLDNHSALESKIYEDPADAAAAAQLEMAYQEEGRSEDLLQLLLTRAENVAEDRERVSLLRQAAELCSNNDDQDSALQILLTAFNLDRGNLELANELDHLAYLTGHWDPVLDAYLVAAADCRDAELAGDLWLRIACAHALVTNDEEALSVALEHVHSVDAEWAQSYLDLVEGQAQGLRLVLTLAQVCLRIGDRPRRARCLTRAIAMSDTVIEKAELHSQLAALHLDDDDQVATNWHLREALRLDPSRQDCHAALIAMSKEVGDVRTAAELLRSQALAGDGGRVEAAFEAAKLYSDLDENTECFDLLAITMAEDPHHLGAALPLADSYYKTKRWSEFEPLINLLIANKHNLPSAAPGIAELYYRAGQCAQGLEDKELAKSFYTKVLALEPEHLKALTANAVVLYDLGELDKAFDANEGIFAQQQDSAESIQARTLHQMAKIRTEQSNPKAALPLAQRAAELSPEFADAGRLLAKTQEELEDYPAALKSRQALIEHVDLKTQVDVHCEIAALRCWRLDDPIGAINEYKLALKKDKENRKVMHSLIDLYSASELWQEAVDVIMGITKLEKEPLRRGKYLDAAGEIIRFKLEDKSATECFNEALDCFFVEAEDLPEKLRNGCMRPFHRLVEFLHEQADYDELERNYRKMIQRLRPSDPLVVQLWQDLGQLYTGKLDRQEDAIASYEVLSTIDGSSNHKRVLLGLYEDSDEKLDQAIAEHHRLLAKKPLEAEHYESLTELYLRAGEPDRAWCATRALVYLQKATEPQKSFYYQHDPKEMRWPRVPISSEMWTKLRHPEELPLVGNIFALIADVMVFDCAVDEAGLLARDGRTHLHNELRDLVRGVAYAMGMPEVRLTVDLDLNADLLFLPSTAGPAFVVGRGIWQTSSVRKRVHVAATSLASARPDAQLQALSTSKEHLEAILMAAVTFVRPDLAIAPHIATRLPPIQQVLGRTLPQPRRVRLAHAVQNLVNSGIRHDINSWWNALECTAQRAALLLSGDLESAVEIANRVGDGAKHIIDDLLVFSVSPSQCDMRRDLSIAITHKAD
jgi:thioredoxin-like negative regulator of GroEL